jgi:hypothetical protein
MVFLKLVNHADNCVNQIASCRVILRNNKAVKLFLVVTSYKEYFWVVGIILHYCPFLLRGFMPCSDDFVEVLLLPKPTIRYLLRWLGSCDNGCIFLRAGVEGCRLEPVSHAWFGYTFGIPAPATREEAAMAWNTKLFVIRNYSKGTRKLLLKGFQFLSPLLNNC